MTVTDFLQEHNVAYREAGESPHVTTGWIGVICPWCDTGSGNYGCGINLQWNVVSCWKCGSHRLLDTLASITGLTWGEVKRELGDIVPERGRERERPGRLILPAGLGSMAKPHRDYLRSRGFDPEELERLWGLRGIGLSARLPWRIWIPIHTRGEVVSWITRACDPANPNRWRSARPDEEKIPAKDTLYGLDHVCHTVIVHEGATDVFRVGPGAVAVLGMGYSRRQLLLLSRIPRRFICFDSGPEAQMRARKLCLALATFPGETHRIELDAADPGSASTKEVTLLRKVFEIGQ